MTGTTHLFAHSLGVHVTGATLREFADRGRTDAVASVSLFGGAIPNDSVGGDGRYGSAIAAIDAPVSTLQPERPDLGGCIGPQIGPAQLVMGARSICERTGQLYRCRDVDVIDLVADHYQTPSRRGGVYRGWSVKLGSSESARRHRDQ